MAGTMAHTEMFRTVLPDVLLEAVRSGKVSLDYAARIVNSSSPERYRPFVDFMGGAGLDECSARLEGMCLNSHVRTERLPTTLARIAVIPFTSLAIGIDKWFANWEVVRE